MIHVHKRVCWRPHLFRGRFRNDPRIAIIMSPLLGCLTLLHGLAMGQVLNFEIFFDRLELDESEELILVKTGAVSSVMLIQAPYSESLEKLWHLSLIMRNKLTGEIMVMESIIMLFYNSVYYRY